MVNFHVLYLIFHQALEKCKRNLEEEKKGLSHLKKENQTLIEACEDLQKKREKYEHELQTKDSRIACLEGQLSHNKKTLDQETEKVTFCFAKIVCP